MSITRNIYWVVIPHFQVCNTRIGQLESIALLRVVIVEKSKMADPEANLCHQNWIQIQNLLLQDSLHFHHQRWLVHHLHHVSLSGPSVPAWGPGGVIVPFPSQILAVVVNNVGAKSAPSKAFEYYLPHPLEFQTFLWPCIRNFSSILRSKVDLFMPSSYILALSSSWNFAKIVIWNVQVMFMLRFFFRPGRKWE